MKAKTLIELQVAAQSVTHAARAVERLMMEFGNNERELKIMTDFAEDLRLSVAKLPVAFRESSTGR